MRRQIAHLDLNSFFASVEQQANPYLRNKPLGIIKASGRTCIIAASPEAKKFGVKTGSRTYDARNLCPQIILIPADFDKYFPVTQELIRICQENCPTVEVFSLDEAFLDLTGFPEPVKIIKKIQKQVSQQIGDQITLSAGLSYNKLLAKLASDLAAKNQILIINQKNKDQILSTIKPSQICGIGPRIEARLFNIGITNLLQIRKTPQQFLAASFGPWWAQNLKNIAWGTDLSPLTPITLIPEAKSVSRTFTLFANTTNQKIIKATLRNLSEEVAAKLRQMKMVGKTIGLGIRGGENCEASDFTIGGPKGDSPLAPTLSRRGCQGACDRQGVEPLGTSEHRERVFLGFHQEKSLQDFTNDGQIIFEKVWQIFQNSYPHPNLSKNNRYSQSNRHNSRPHLHNNRHPEFISASETDFKIPSSVRFLGVWATNLFPKNLLTPSLLPQIQKREKILKAIDQINTRFGSLTIFPGVLLGQKLIHPEVTGYLGDKKLRFNSL